MTFKEYLKDKYLNFTDFQKGQYESILEIWYFNTLQEESTDYVLEMASKLFDTTILNRDLDYLRINLTK